jgi:hypothetical protein
MYLKIQASFWCLIPGIFQENEATKMMPFKNQYAFLPALSETA